MGNTNKVIRMEFRDWTKNDIHVVDFPCKTLNESSFGEVEVQDVEFLKYRKELAEFECDFYFMGQWTEVYKLACKLCELAK